jgi:peroxiredoxin
LTPKKFFGPLAVWDETYDRHGAFQEHACDGCRGFSQTAFPYTRHFHHPKDLAMTIAVGDRIPEATLAVFQDGIQTVSSTDVLGQGKVVLFAVPGAFTPTCSNKHLPGYIQHLEEFTERGVKVACLSVNDAFVMHAWGESQGVPADLLMLGDGNATFAKALGLELDGTKNGMGIRAKRFALYAEDGVVKVLNVEAPGEFRVSMAETMLQAIDG